ncbi:MAG: SDR family oxidoreductase [Chloroflexi bacterium]|nr:SDR family oxidoreductase [Chloroflexota bacterium]
MNHVFVTGTSRGIGLEIVRQLSERPKVTVYAACRNPEAAAELQAVASNARGTVHPIPLEVTDPAQIAATKEFVRSHTNVLDVLINNAGIDPDDDKQRLGRIDPDVMLHTLHVNTVAPLLIAQAFVDLLQASSLGRIINISSEMGSIAQRNYGGSYAYCASKAALNMSTRGLAADLGRQGIVCVTIDPGWVKTDMGGRNAPLEREESVLGLLRVIERLTRADNGSYKRWNGRSLPW